MTCPYCSSTNIYVSDTAQGTDGKVYRRRHCRDCNARFRTVESCMENTASANEGYLEAVKNKSSVVRAYYDGKENR